MHPLMKKPPGNNFYFLIFTLEGYAARPENRKLYMNHA